MPIHIGGSSRAAARRAGRRGDGYFPGGALDPNERAIQLDLARSTAVEAGRNPETLEYTRSGPIDMTVDQVEEFAAQGVTRIVVSATATEPDRQREEMSAFAQRFALLEHLSPSTSGPTRAYSLLSNRCSASRASRPRRQAVGSVATGWKSATTAAAT
ncbi:LLM class flavin-dependent oxidoreductase [Streptosporangium sp. NPDC049248]|uniref:LLM class flavin-dependent oxidoreductase n=1 Tax=Streptosporangium sp. NPDC049248 TaxID=3155651 RepID=UPI003433CAE8